MKKLFLLRHAKSDWTGNSGSDHSRPVSSRGREDARRLGKWMLQQQLLPQQIISSDAFRTQQTVEFLTEAWHQDADIQFSDVLYLADYKTMLDLIQSIPDTVQSAMLVAHNPGMDDLVSFLSNKELPFTDDGKLMATCNLAIFEVASNWSAIAKHSLHLTDIVRPQNIS